ncbi:outer membrane lipoprotein-sorting protein [Pseudooceanicola antarcticus]|uniref:Outer membrane lipoprotein-sorting protein n=1 Tax=Pseudooceanicola antarcticus TaxID=1247613 RepID=A0A285IU47_9RHOB|nr:outer membrane lipoprotein-sorting protein [Pseudooceanicola antarcticus]PJE32009.1 outer membrane lipoprotein-sorting protein [Pseudooceanicola antarcticus]SNY51217.1 outer membrane lipoprotein-sorting protein [Pseudooceanicola antarcticus]
MTKTMFTAIAAIVAALFIGLGPASAETTQEKGLRIAQSVGQEPGFRDQAAEGEMILTTKSGQTSIRRFEARAVETSPGETRSVLTFLWPGDIRNTTLLTHSHAGGRDDDQWLYLPAVSKVRRISSSGRSGSFVGSEFAYEDMSDQDVDKYTYNWVADGSCPGGGRCHIVDRFPRGASAYSYERVWIEQSRKLIQKVEYYDRRKAHLKTMLISGYRKHNGKYWRAAKMEMSNHLTGKGTTLTWDGFTFDRGVNPNDLTVSALRKGL